MLRVLFRRFVSFCLLFLVLTGCATSTIVNLTPPSLPKSEDGLYRFEASWESNQRSILEESLQVSWFWMECSIPWSQSPWRITVGKLYYPCPPRGRIICISLSSIIFPNNFLSPNPIAFAAKPFPSKLRNKGSVMDPEPREREMPLSRSAIETVLLSLNSGPNLHG